MKRNIFQASVWMALVLVGFLSACEDPFAFPEAGSLEDLTPPQADFSFEQNEANYLEFTFSNTSISATDYEWNFGDGTTSTEKSPSHEFAGVGSYTISLTASDKRGATSEVSETIVVEEPVVLFTPEILNPGFDIEGEDSYRDHWRNGDLGGVLQITSSPVHDGEKAAKFPSAGDRIAYQLIDVQPNKTYTVSFYYTMKESPAGSMTVAILAGDVTDPAAVESATLASVELTDQTDADTYVSGSVTFESGNNAKVAIFISNKDVETRIDTFEITEDE
ncbi:PKD domain-containing protein [Pontibacter sp. G13]|uniref:PKD domain-containing protein n=1 Tax=Pontibacter sp. G13 TaxID=3074898 RepID=UPI00288AABBB|nr:PKD domain-containing protein [Pontibacter sp. G13]WNJ18676.1 PKD domain-containing protein [Pontibacter sp. G13]